MSSEQKNNREEWARNFADLAGIEFVPLVQTEDTDHDTVVIKYLYERHHRFEVMAIAMRYVDKDYGAAKIYVHAENWLVIEVELPGDLFRLPEGSKAAR